MAALATNATPNTVKERSSPKEAIMENNQTLRLNILPHLIIIILRVKYSIKR